MSSKYLRSTCLKEHQTSPARQKREMGLMVSNEAERSPKLELEKLSSLREGWNATGELNHAWEKAQCTRRKASAGGRWGSRNC